MVSLPPSGDKKTWWRRLALISLIMSCEENYCQQWAAILITMFIKMHLQKCSYMWSRKLACISNHQLYDLRFHYLSHWETSIHWGYHFIAFRQSVRWYSVASILNVYVKPRHLSMNSIMAKDYGFNYYDFLTCRCNLYADTYYELIVFCELKIV